MSQLAVHIGARLTASERFVLGRIYLKPMGESLAPASKPAQPQPRGVHLAAAIESDSP